MPYKLETNQRVRYDKDTGALCCPRCGESNGLHHTGTTVFSRSREDAPSTDIAVSGHTIKFAASGSNPSARRDGVTISFECEHCGPVSDLAIAQHKGTTYLEWRSIYDPTAITGRPS